MSLQKIVMATAAAATICHLINPKDIGIIHFGTKGHTLKRFGEDISPENLVEKIFALRPQGFTNMYQGLFLAINELGERKNTAHTVILLSDCDLNYGKVPSPITWKLQGLNIITIPPVNEFIANTIVKETNGQLYSAKIVADIPVILKQIFSSK